MSLELTADDPASSDVLAHLLDVARQRGVQGVSLETGAQPESASARALYRVAGFEPCGPCGSYGPSEASSCFSLDLGATR
ncbi:MAG: hypothetical protein JWN88_1576 [Frankiales bacterium]|jgi:putative acetyltransferase|nr:hypothetical protein [Frankiales bacterium]